MISARITKLRFYQGNTQVVTLEGLQDVITGGYVNDAVLQMSLVDEYGNVIAGCDQVAMNYIPDSNGNYQGIFGDQNFYPDVGTGYRLYVDGSSSGSFIHLELSVEVSARRF